MTGMHHNSSAATGITIAKTPAYAGVFVIITAQNMMPCAASSRVITQPAGRDQAAASGRSTSST